MKFVTKQK